MKQARPIVEQWDTDRGEWRATHICVDLDQAEKLVEWSNRAPYMRSRIQPADGETVITEAETCKLARQYISKPVAERIRIEFGEWRPILFSRQNIPDDLALMIQITGAELEAMHQALKLNDG